MAEAMQDDDRPGEPQLLLDSLPYIDEHLGLPATHVEALLDEADRLIDEELEHSDRSPEQLLDELLPLPAGLLAFEGSELLRREWQRIEAGDSLPELDLSGYQPREPGDPESAAAWRQELDRVRANLEHQRARLLNLELMNRYGRDSWEQLAESSQAEKLRLARVQRQVQEEVDTVNRKRKQDQLGALDELARNRLEWYNLAAKNNELEFACAQLEAQIKRARASAQQ